MAAPATLGQRLTDLLGHVLGVLRRLRSQLGFLLAATALVFTTGGWGLYETWRAFVRPGLFEAWECQLDVWLRPQALCENAQYMGRFPTLLHHSTAAAIGALLLPAFALTCAALGAGVRIMGAFVPSVRERTKGLGWLALVVGTLVLVLDVVVWR